ncbi:GTPase HflX [Sulfolobus sp. A20-N-F6]|uniref:GTPase HflX n=1 Tax=Saccharolobus sp. A20 TaxID=1891280 RepID=UPI000845D086|nr:GTPase HflX [Sulfolobus sp. A20]TRM76553.1 GTPase HflX [Sulfolobus sp. B5]TRM77769.1 GTPase HflX [Sulfolobus sp. A20-N-F8]TRM81430.1 GTPase HflX [Sulfolobus sp. D5]TRM83920.1 GTPase HflX [Sulfolobus sp. A20-N-F6]TRM88717.1 GTPase HflX [Sulfolobus sp. C3]TRN03107.1 GTPase HflX [Sulfolobus sp. E1]
MKKAILFVSDHFKEEAIALAEGAEYKVLEIYPLPKSPNPKFYIQMNKLRKIEENDLIDAIIIFDILKPRHFINLRRELKQKEIIDKVLLLLEIFALHAGSKEAKMQIELARLKYELPIIKEAYTKLKLGEQQGLLGSGGYGFESLIKLYRRKINKLSKELENIKKFKEKSIEANKRAEYTPTIAIVGYTNSGKTSLFNTLTSLSQKVDSKLFTTMAPKRYSISLKDKKIMLVDTVGFIRGIPPQVIDSFFVTLSEAKYSDALLLLLDSTLNKELIIETLTSSFQILREIGVSGKPIIVVLNKIDKLDGDLDQKIELVKNKANELYSPIYDTIPVSALKRVNIDLLRDRVYQLITELT